MTYNFTLTEKNVYKMLHNKKKKKNQSKIRVNLYGNFGVTFEDNKFFLVVSGTISFQF